MNWYSAEFWEVVLDVIGLCLVGTVIIYMIRNKKAYRQNLLETGSDPNVKDITEFHDMLLKSLQQSEIAFETVSDALKKERKILEQLKKVREKKDIQPPVPNVREDPDNLEDQYRKAMSLYKSGLDAEQISKQVNISKNEIELMIKLNAPDEKEDRGPKN